jgi:integrase/recombinase XerD
MTNNLQIISSQNNSLVIIEEISEELVWLENFTSKATQKTYKAALTKFCQMFEIKNIEELRAIGSMHIIKFRDTMKEVGEKNATINNRLAGLSSLFKHLIEKQVVKSNPVYGVKTMKKDYRNVKSRALTDAEVDAILCQPDTNKLIGLRDKAILSIMFNIGTRVGTIKSLRGNSLLDIFSKNQLKFFQIEVS